MKAFTKNNLTYISIAIGFILLALLPYMGLNLYLISFIFILMMNISLTVGWNILGGYAGYVSFGHAAFVGAGGYTTAILLSQFGWSPIFTTPLAGVVSALIALIVGYPSLRLRGPYFSVITLVIALAIAALVLNLPGINTASGIFVKPPSDSVFMSNFILYEMMAVVLFITILIAQIIEKSKFGLGLIAIREDEEVASTQGVNATKVKLTAYVISGGLAGVVGGIFSWYQGVIYVNSMFSVNLSVMIVLMAILGGTYSWKGAFIGALLVTIINEVLVLSIGSNLSQIIFGVLLVVAILYLPNGIIGLIKNSRTVDLKWKKGKGV
ncbi:branched-chain amino acid ABC transporter permease [Sporosarcina sp. FSL W8-0480]|uniref:branched-chain amino acid ABC transporter permease n=1 Tax=Sporosarcina sp. FSL W8-0480 TaxID=2954701 RepID=UPI0030DAB888